MSGGCGGVSLAPGGRWGEYGFFPSVLLPAGSCGGAGCAGSGGSHIGGGLRLSALLLGDGGSGRAPAPLLGIARGQEQGRAGAGMPLFAHEGEDPAGRTGSEPAGTTQRPRGRPLPSPLLGLRGNDGLHQQVLVEVRLEEPWVGVLGEQRRQDPAQPCTAQPRPHPPSSSACRCASGHRPSRSDGASLCPPVFAPSSCCRYSPSVWPREPGTAWGVTDGVSPAPPWDIAP